MQPNRIRPRPALDIHGKGKADQDGPAMDRYSAFGTSDLAEYIRTHAIRAEIIRLTVETPTVERAAAAVGTLPEQIVKSLLFLVSDEPLLVVARGMENVDRRSLGRYLSVGKKHLILARPEVVFSITGYPVGALPPFGHRAIIRTLVDRRVTGQPVVFAGGGSSRALLRMEPAELIRVCGGEIVDVRLSSETGEA